MLLCHRVGRHLEQDETISRSQRLVKTVVDFVLATSVFMVNLLQIKTQRCEVLAHIL